MRTTVTIDDELLATAKQFAGTDDTGDVIRKGLKMLIEWEASRRLAAMGGWSRGGGGLPIGSFELLGALRDALRRR